MQGHAPTVSRYIHATEGSTESRQLQTFLLENRMKGFFASIVAGDVDPGMLKSAFGMDDVLTAPPVPRSFLDFTTLSIDRIGGRSMWTLRPRSGSSERTIFYLHGGGYVLNLTVPHWNFLERLARLANATIVVPDYPLAPAYTFADVHTFVGAAYARVLEETNAASVTIMGDSAGGGLGLSFTQCLRDSRAPLPAQVIVMSPWLDVTVSNPDIDAVDDRDHLLGTRGLQRAGLAYAGSRDPRSPLISPLYGSFAGMPPIAVFQGTHDIFVADSRKLIDRLDSEDRADRYFEYPNQIHVWALFDMPEATSAVQQMVELLRA